MRKRIVLLGIVSIGACLMLNKAALSVQKIKAQEDEAGNFAASLKPTNWFGESIRSGNLLFGITTGLRPEASYGIPDVTYIDKEPTSEEDLSGYIHHLYKQRDGEISTSSVLNLVEKANRKQEYDHTDELNMAQANPGRNPVNLLTAGQKIGETIVSTGKKMDYEKTVSNGQNTYNENFEVKVEMLADGKKNRIMHNYTVTNVGDSEQTIYPMKIVDTDLANNDKVPIFARGDNSGVYIEANNSLTPEDDRKFRLDYFTNVENGPISYQGNSMTESFQKVFGDDLDNPETPVANMAEGEIVMGPGGPPTINSDTAIFMHWGKKVLKPGESAEMSYAVGITVTSALEVAKTGENQTSTDGLNRVGDVIEYTATALNRSKGELTNLEFVNALPETLDKPTDITVIEMDGTEVPQAESVYDAASHTITVTAPKLSIGKEISLRYSAQLKSEAAETMVENVTTISAKDEKNNFHEELVVHQLEVLGLGNVLVQYQDTEGKTLAESKTLTGSVGDDYEEQALEIFGYTYQKVTGEPKGKFTKADQTVTFIYDQTAGNELYDLVQKVVNSGGVNVDQGEAAVNEELTYSAILTTKTAGLTEAELASEYKEVVIKEELDPSLDNVKDVTLRTEAGTTVGTANYDELNHQVTATVTAADKVKVSDKLIVTYKASVKSGTPAGTKIKQKATSDVSFDITGEVVYQGSSNEVETTVTQASMMLVRYVNEDGDDIHEPKTYELAEDGSYDEKEIAIDGFTFDHAEGETSGTAAPGESVLIIFHYQSEQFKLVQEVSHLDGSSAEFVKNEAELRYTLKLTSQLKDETVTYNDFSIVEAIDPSLENIKEVKLVNSAGETVGQAEYANGFVTASLTAEDELKGTEDLVLSYEATVKNKDLAPEGTEITAQATASGSYNGATLIPAREQISNEVLSVIGGGELIFESAPATLNFGDDLKLSLQAKDYPFVSKDGDLVVSDTRGKKEVWSMTAKMTKLMSNGQHKLPESMYYVLAGKEQLMTLDTSANVYDKVTESDTAIVISDEWQGVKVGPVLKVGKNEARRGNYQGVIQWTLQDVPLDE